MKYPVIRAKTDRVDVEVIGPSEALDLETECGSGLCQQLAGDFLFHCHVAHHYVAGMWGYWRVYNTIQQGDLRNDVMPDLRELPDRKGRIKAPISSDKLIGQTVDWFGTKFKIVDKGKSNWKTQPGHDHDQGLGGNAAADAWASPAIRTMKRARSCPTTPPCLDWTWNGNHGDEREGKHDRQSQVQVHAIRASGIRSCSSR